jgi:hypothetical protein
MSSEIVDEILEFDFFGIRAFVCNLLQGFHSVNESGQKRLKFLTFIFPPWVIFTNILRAHFAPIFLRRKSPNLKCKHKKASRETFVRKKTRVKCW